MVARAFIACLLLALVIIAGVAAITHQALWRPLANPAVEFEVQPGSPARKVLSELADTGLLPSEAAGRLYLALWGADREFRYGHYRIHPGSRPVDVLEKILNGEVKTVRVTVAEGLSAQETIELFIAAGFGDEKQWQRTISRAQAVHYIAPQALSLEGFLFPDTYDFAVGVTTDIIANHMVDQFRRVWQELNATVEEPWGSPFETLTLASLVEAETSLPSERPKIAGVFTNRLERGMLLQCDPTVVYALKRNSQWQGRLLQRHWLFDDPYNTYRYPGLPPSPINSPGRAALAAALAPETHSFLYFVARPGGGHTFSRTLADHNQAVAVWRRARR